MYHTLESVNVIHQARVEDARTALPSRTTLSRNRAGWLATLRRRGLGKTAGAATPCPTC